MESASDQSQRESELLEQYTSIRPEIESRLAEFRQMGEKGSEEDLFRELVFCLLTPQSRARLCWSTVERLTQRCLLAEGEPGLVREEMKGVRFSKRKAEYICQARRTFNSPSLRSRLREFDSAFQAREWLVQNVLGLGYKEASHFLRNVGRGGDLAILDRHILKNLQLLGVIESIPASLSRKTYLEFEERMRELSRRIGIPMDHLDLLLWYKEAGEIFK
jgi:N-glycosylase/DNA lyase